MLKLHMSYSGYMLIAQMLFFGSRCERLCMIQFSLISLIPGLIDSLEDSADPAFDNYSQSIEKPTSLKTSERNSCMACPAGVVYADNSVLAYMGLPLQIFGKVCSSASHSSTLIPTGKHVWSIYPLAAAGPAGRYRDQVVRRGVDELAPPTAERSLQ